MRAMFTTLLEKTDPFSLLLWILSQKHRHTNISGAVIRFQLNDRKHENSEKTRTFPQWADSEHLDFSKLQMLVILNVSSKAGAMQAGLAPEHPLSSSACSWDCRALGLDISRALPQWVQSPGQSAAISLMSSLPHQRIASKSIF